MNKLYGRGPKGNVLACILEPGNIERLKKNQPIEIDLNDGPWKQGLPPKIQIVIAYSETPIADWNAVTEDNRQCVLFVHRILFPDTSTSFSELENDLVAVNPPQQLEKKK